jgi:hypothetical protein
MMKSTKSVTLVVVVLFALGWAACAGTLGRWPYRVVSVHDKHTVLEELKRNWRDYNIYSDGPVETTAAVVFDPKNDDRKLLGYRYVKVENQRNVEVAVNWIESYLTFNPTLYRIYDEEGRFYGYVFIALYIPVPQRVDDRTLMLQQHQSPLYFVG